MNLIITLLISLSISTNFFTTNRKIDKLHNTIINFFLNKELTFRNNEIIGVFDYLPNLKSKKNIEPITVVKRIEFSTLFV